MTIYTSSPPEKKPEKDLEPEVVTEPLVDKDKEAAAAAANVLRVNYLRTKRRTALLHMVLAMIVLAVLALGAIGSVFLYRHFNKKVYTGRCGLTFYDQTFHDSLEAEALTSDAPVDSVEEDWKVCGTEMYEEMHTQAFDEVRESFVFHDFMTKYTVIIDHKTDMCFIQELKKTIIRPDEFRVEVTFQDGYIHAAVSREDFVLSLIIPQPMSLHAFGRTISSKCAGYDIYWLERYYVGGISKRSVSPRRLDADEVAQQGILGAPVVTYAVYTNNATDPVLYKIRIHEPKGKVPEGLPRRLMEKVGEAIID